MKLLLLPLSTPAAGHFHIIVAIALSFYAEFLFKYMTHSPVCTFCFKHCCIHIIFYALLHIEGG